MRHRGVIVYQPARGRTGRNRPLIRKATGTGLTDNEPGIKPTDMDFDTSTSLRALAKQSIFLATATKDGLLRCARNDADESKPMSLGINTRSGLVSRHRNLVELAGHPAAPGKSHRRRRPAAEKYEVLDVNHDGQNTGRQLCASSR